MVPGESNGHVTGNVTWPWQVEVVTPICWHPLSSTWLETHVELWLHVTLNFLVIQLHSDRNILWVLQMALDRLRVPCSFEHYLVNYTLLHFILYFSVIFSINIPILVSIIHVGFLIFHFKEFSFGLHLKIFLALQYSIPGGEILKTKQVRPHWVVKVLFTFLSPVLSFKLLTTYHYSVWFSYSFFIFQF